MCQCLSSTGSALFTWLGILRFEVWGWKLVHMKYWIFAVRLRSNKNVSKYVTSTSDYFPQVHNFMQVNKALCNVKICFYTCKYRDRWLSIICVFIDVAMMVLHLLKHITFPFFFLYTLTLTPYVWSKATKYTNIRVAINSHCTLSLNRYKGKTDHMPYFILVSVCSI